MLHDEEVEYVKAANALRIATVVPARQHFAAAYARPRSVSADAGEAAAMAIELACQRVSTGAIVDAIDRQFVHRPLPGPSIDRKGTR